MNYIKSLQEKVRLLEAQNSNAQEQINHFKAFLCSPKFTGTESD
jgi:hypothetical protein